MVSKTKKKEKFPVKKYSVSGDKVCDFTYTFQRSNSDIPKENRELRRSDDTLLKNLKLPHYIYRNNRYNCMRVLDKLNQLKLCKWYHCSLGLSYIYDNMSVRAHTFFTITDEGVDIYVDYLYQDFLDYCINTLGMQRLHKDKIRTVCEWFVVNLNRALSKNKIAICYRRSQKTYQDFDSKYGMKFPYPVMKKLVKFLEYKELIINLTGYDLEKDNSEGDPVISTMILSEGLFKYYNDDNDGNIIDPIQLAMCQVRDEKKNPMPILSEWTDVIESSNKLVESLNDMYANTDIKVNGQIVPDIILSRIWTGDIFNCGRFFDQGQYQQFDKKSRSTTEINDEECSFLDYGSLHPSLLYNIEGVKLDKDPYPTLKIKTQKVLVNRFKKYYKHGKYEPSRNLCKLVMLCMINASSREKALSAVVQKLYLDRAKIGKIKREKNVKYCGLPMDISIGEIMDIIIKTNKPIEKYFFTGIGLRLMNYDSRILEHVLTKAVETNTPIIPLHDEAICMKKDCNKVKVWLEEGYVKVMGNNLNCKIDIE